MAITASSLITRRDSGQVWENHALKGRLDWSDTTASQKTDDISEEMLRPMYYRKWCMVMSGAGAGRGSGGGGRA
uniref:SFRICE_039249 n=1 Tax=Spodoptera frugiperda TaxID=7108 RepID=A0A2H1WQJ7_SPOFR